MGFPTGWAFCIAFISSSNFDLRGLRLNENWTKSEFCYQQKMEGPMHLFTLHITINKPLHKIGNFLSIMEGSATKLFVIQEYIVHIFS